MTPRPDHRRPAAAFAVLFVVAMLVLGNGLRAHAEVGTWVVAGDPVLPRVVQILVSPPGDRPSQGPAKPVVGPRHRSPLAVGSRGRRSPRATMGRAPHDAVPARRTRAGHRSGPAEADGSAGRPEGHAAGPVRSAPWRAVGHSHRAAGHVVRQQSRRMPGGHGVGAGHLRTHGHHGSGR